MLARRGTVIIAVVVIASLVIVAVASYGSSGNVAPAPTLRAAQTDPNRLIAAATANPNDAETIQQLADYFGRTGQYQRALDLYTHLVELRPNDATAHVSVGELSLQQGDIARAQREFQQTLVLKPADPIAARAHLGLGEVFGAQTPPRLADAQNELNLAAMLDPTSDTAANARAQLAALPPPSPASPMMPTASVMVIVATPAGTKAP